MTEYLEVEIKPDTEKRIKSRLLKIIGGFSPIELEGHADEKGRYRFRDGDYSYSVYQHLYDCGTDMAGNSAGHELRQGWSFFKGKCIILEEDNDSQPWDLIKKKLSPLLIERANKERDAKQKKRERDEADIEGYLRNSK